MPVAFAIEVNKLDFCYPGETTPALQDISLAVKAGSCFGLIGPNGAGKSTLLSIFTGILPLQAGVIAINGQSTIHLHESALVPQEYAFYDALTLRENLECFAGLYGLKGNGLRERIDFAVTVCGLQALLERLAADCSGGIKRRLNLAIGLLNAPKILYLDEPTVGIDAQSRHFILESIARLQREGMTIVYTSHYMEEIQTICDSVAIIDHGRLLVQDSLQNILARAEAMPLQTQAQPQAQSAKRLEDYYLSITHSELRD